MELSGLRYFMVMYICLECKHFGVIFLVIINHFFFGLCYKCRLTVHISSLKSITPCGNAIISTYLQKHRFQTFVSNNFHPWTLHLLLKTLDTFGCCQRPVFSSQHMPKIKKICENLNSIGRRSREIIMEEKTLELRAFRCLISGPQNLILRSLNQIREKLLLSRKLHYFKGSRFLPSKVLC